MLSQILWMAYETKNCVSLVVDAVFSLAHPFQDTLPGSTLAPRTGAEDWLLALNCVGIEALPSLMAHFLFLGGNEAAF